MSAFDKAFADRVREVAEGYREPTDPAALARMRAALGHTPPVAADRPPVMSARSRARRGLWVAVAAVVVASGVWIQTRPAPPDPGPIAESTRLGETAGTADAPVRPSTDSVDEASATAQTASAARTPSSQARRPAVVPSPGEPRRGASERRVSPPPDRVASSAPAQVPAMTGSRPQPDRTRSAPDPAAASSLSGPAQSVPEVDIAPLPALAVATDAEAPNRSALFLPTRSEYTRSLARVEGDAASPYRIIVSTSAPLVANSDVSGVGISGGVTREWPVAGRVSVSGGAVVAYNRYEVDRPFALNSPTLADLGRDPTSSVDQVANIQAETVALEIPLDLAFDVAGTRRTRVGVSVGVTSAVYLSQTSQIQGTSFSGTVVGDAPGDGTFEIEQRLFDESASGGILGRVDLARQLNLGVQLARTQGWSTEVYTRLPLGGLTDRDLKLAAVGVRLRVPIR